MYSTKGSMYTFCGLTGGLAASEVNEDKDFASIAVVAMIQTYYASEGEMNQIYEYLNEVKCVW